MLDLLAARKPAWTFTDFSRLTLPQIAFLLGAPPANGAQRVRAAVRQKQFAAFDHLCDMLHVSRSTLALLPLKEIAALLKDNSNQRVDEPSVAAALHEFASM